MADHVAVLRHMTVRGKFDDEQLGIVLLARFR
jgi:hypothetical protein